MSNTQSVNRAHALVGVVSVASSISSAAGFHRTRKITGVVTGCKITVLGILFVRGVRFLADVVSAIFNTLNVAVIKRLHELISTIVYAAAGGGEVSDLVLGVDGTSDAMSDVGEVLKKARFLAGVPKLIFSTPGALVVGIVVGGWEY